VQGLEPVRAPEPGPVLVREQVTALELVREQVLVQERVPAWHKRPQQERLPLKVLLDRKQRIFSLVSTS